MNRVYTFTFMVSLLFTIIISCEKEPEELKAIASFTINGDSAHIFDTIYFMNQSENSINYIWNFGDGNTSFEKNPIHIFEKIETYEISLISSNEISSDTISRLIQINGLPITKENISAKWEITGDEANTYEFIDFLECGKFILNPVTSNGILDAVFRDYEIDNGTIDLNGYGIVSDITLAKDSIEFQLNLYSDLNESISIKAKKANLVSKSIKTELLSKYWEATTYQGEPTENSNIGIELLFSKYGSYNYFYSDGEVDGYGMFYWSWKDGSEEVLCYSVFENELCNGIGEMNISVTGDELTTSYNGIITTYKEKVY